MSPVRCDVSRQVGSLARVARIGLVLHAAGLAACTGESFGPPPPFSDCSLPLANFTDAGVERSSIPALTNPDVATRLIAPQVGYINRGDLVIGLQFNDQPLAIPLKLLWYHEVLNLQADSDPADPSPSRERLTITYSPLTGSVRVFDPAATETPDFEVSNYVLDNSLVMDDGSGTLYPQLTRSATCGPNDGSRLKRVPYELLVYGAWLQIFQDTWIATRVTGHDFLYTLYPYGNYRDPDNASLFYPTSAPIDLRRRPKERVVGVPSGTGGVAFAISDLREVAARDQEGQNFTVWAASARAGGEPVVAFWNSVAQSARIYHARANGRALTFEVADGRRQDVETGSVWNFGGEAVAGPLEGEQLEAHAEAYHAFWFAWAAFQPDTEVWVAPIPLTGSADFVPTDDATLLPPDPDLIRRRPR